MLSKSETGSKGEFLEPSKEVDFAAFADSVDWSCDRLLEEPEPLLIKAVKESETEALVSPTEDAGEKSRLRRTARRARRLRCRLMRSSSKETTRLNVRLQAANNVTSDCVRVIDTAGDLLPAVPTANLLRRKTPMANCIPVLN